MADFDRYTSSYEEHVEHSIAFSGRGHGFFHEVKARRLLALARRRLGDLGRVRALDVGCGDGAFDTYLGEIGSLEGVDASEAMVEKARQTNPDGVYRVADGTVMPYDQDSFDLVFTVCVLHHVEPGERDPFVTELRRVTRPGALVVAFEHNPWNPLTRLGVHRCAFDEDVQLLRRRELASRLRRAGLRVLDQAYLLFVPWHAPRLDRLLAGVPLGAQYYVAAES